MDFMELAQEIRRLRQEKNQSATNGEAFGYFASNVECI